MALMSYNVKCPRRDFGYISQMTTCVLGLSFNFSHDTRNFGFLPGLLVEMYKYIEVAYGNFFTEKQTGETQIKMRGDNIKRFIDMLYNVLFVSEFCD